MLAVIIQPFFGKPAQQETVLAWQIYSTQTGEQQEIELVDGSRIAINAASSLSISLSENERRVRLTDAEASFDVAHDAQRPFLVEMDEFDILVLGTEFNVDHHDNLVRVTVRRGQVQVKARLGDATSYILNPDQELIYRKGESRPVVRTVDSGAAFAWQRGVLIYDEAPITDVVNDLNRMFDRPILTSEDLPENLTFTGVLQTDEQVQIVERLEIYLQIVADIRADAITFHAPR